MKKFLFNLTVVVGAFLLIIMFKIMVILTPVYNKYFRKE